MRIVFVANRLDHGLCLSVVGPAATPPELLNHEKGDEDIADTARGRCDGGGGGSIIGPAGSSEAAPGPHALWCCCVETATRARRGGGDTT